MSRQHANPFLSMGAKFRCSLHATGVAIAGCCHAAHHVYSGGKIPLKQARGYSPFTDCTFGPHLSIEGRSVPPVCHELSQN
jgi:hypothetical protein